jgi:cell pole-organizing protein PopZ
VASAGCILKWLVDMSVETQEKQDTLDQVLDKIKQAIEKGDYAACDNKFQSKAQDDEDVLELNEAINIRNQDTPPDSSQLEVLIKNFAKRINESRHVLSEAEVEGIFKEMLRPYLKSWLNSNLHAMVKPILKFEVRAMLNKLFNDAH